MTPNTAPATQPSRLMDDYSPPAGVYDEMCTAAGEVRAHWRFMLETLDALGPAGLDERWREARRLIRDNGVTYNLFGDPFGMSRPWDLDLLPHLITSEEWAALERGLIQRAELLRQILLDLYGPRELITSGLLPMELVHGHEGYLFPCQGVRVQGDQPLIHYGVDLARGPDGAWCVIADRTQGPSGAGYALENRVVLSRVLPSLFRDSQVHRLAGFFRAMRRALMRLSPAQGRHAQIVFMTPGPRHEAYFEHAYLANYLGYSLVQGADLSVRDGALWLRTIGRLERIDVVLRRVDDQWCDALDLRADSQLGVPGLIQAVRAGSVTLANALGSGVLEYPGLSAYLPAICQHLLGEELLLCSAPTWWCGEPEAREELFDRFDELIVERLDERRPLVVEHLERDERERLHAAMMADPARYVARSLVAASTAPALIGNRLEPRPIVLRSFLVAADNGYIVMPGGLSRVAPSSGTTLSPEQLGGLGKDTWVLASEPERQETLFASGDHQAPAVIRETDVSSRVADNLFWIGRYAERAEGLVRLLRIIIFKLAERASFSAASDRFAALHSLLVALTRQTQTLPGFVGEGSRGRLRNPVPEMLSVISDPARLGALPQTLQALVQAAWSIRDRLSVDTWRVINEVEARFRSLTKQPPSELADALDELDPLITTLVAFSGLTQENMTHNEGWHFIECGRRLERGANLATLLDATLAAEDTEHEETLTIEAILEVTDSLITYRRRYQAGTRVGALLELVCQDEHNPRSLAYQLVALDALVDAMPREASIHDRSPAKKRVLKMLTRVRLAEIDGLIRPDDHGEGRPELGQLLGELGDDLAALSDALTAQYFRHEEQPHSLVGNHRGEKT